MARRQSGSGPRKPAEELKDCLVQARVPRELQSALREEARRRRLSVSHLIRNVLEDTVTLVDNVCAEVENLVDDSVGLAQQVRRDAATVAASAADLGEAVRARRGVEDGPPGRADGDVAADAQAAAEPDDPLAHFYAWNPVVLNRPAHCARCQAVLGKGARAHLGLTPGQGAPPTWLCDDCIDAL